MHLTKQFPVVNRPLTSTQMSRPSLWIRANKMSKIFLAGLIAAMTLLAGHDVLADTFYSKGATGDPTLLTSWTNTSAANPANFTSGDTFVILNGCNFTIPAAGTWTVNATTAGTAATVQINSTGVLTFLLGSAQGGTLKIGGNLVQTAASATVGLVGSGTTAGGTIEFTSNGTWTGSGDISNPKISVTVDSGATLDASGLTTGLKFRQGNTVGITVNGGLNVGTLTINGNNGTGNKTNEFFTLGASGTLITATTSASGLPGIFTGFTVDGKITLPATANYIFNGSAAQVTGTTANHATMPSTINNLTINNTAGLTLSQATTVNGTLALTAGKVTGNVTLSSSATISGGSSTAYLNGQLTVPFTAPTSATYIFPVGTASAYSPVSLANFTDAGAGTLTVSATAATPPNLGSSGIDGSLYIARYWTLTGSGFSSPTYDFTGTYVAGDIQGGANPANLIVRKWDGASWSAPTTSASVAYTVTGTGFNTSFGQFAAGEAQTTLPILDSTTKSAITNTSATLGATLENNFSLPITDYGIVWGTSPSPTTANNKVQVGTSTPTLGSPFTANVTGLSAATTIYYRGYAINASGTGYSTNGTLTTLTNEPAIQASGVNMVVRQNGNLFVSWTRGNGSKCIVLVKAVSAVDSNPVDGTTYTANAAFSVGSQIGSGNYVAYLGTGTSVTLTGLTAATAYYVAVYELNGSGGTENYLDPPATGNQTTIATPISLLTWNGSVDSDWNNTNNWDLLAIPDVGTPSTIPVSGNPPLYANKMVATSIGSVTQSGALTIATNGFVIDAAGAVPLTIQPSGFLTINSNGVLVIANSGSVTMTSPTTTGTSPVIDVEGGTLIVTNSSTFLMGGNDNSDNNIGAAFTNNNGNVTISSQLNVRSRDSRFYMSGGTFNTLGGLYLNSSANDMRQFFRFAGGTANLGDININRASTAGGLSLEGAVVNSSSIQIGTGVTASNARMTSGIWTNAGVFYVANRNNASTSTDRRVWLTMSGGSLVNLGSGGIIINNQGQSSTANLSLNGGNLVVSGGTITTEGITLNASAVTANSYATFQFSGGTIYLGTIGLVANENSGNSLTALLTLSGGTFGAKADWTSSANLPLTGTLSFNAADAAGSAHNITLNGALSGGTGALVKTGAGTLTLNGTNTYSGATTISAGTLTLGASSTLPNTTPINVTAGATFDASAPGGFTLSSGKLLGGSGTVAGAFTAASGSTITVGDSVGTLTFSGGLTLANNVLVNFEISPLTNDLVEITGNLNLSAGTNTISVSPIGGILAPGTYNLIHYSGTLTGDVTNLALVGAPGYLTNNATAQAIQLVTTGLRGPGSVTWQGGLAANAWDVLTTKNWLNSAVPDSFVQGDAVLFDATGAANSSVNIVNPVNPASVTVNAATDYTFSGSGAIGGSGGLTKTNTGTLVVLTTNSYAGPTVIGQGTLEISQLANGGANSAIGSANNNTTNLVFYGSTLRYTGASASTDRGATLNDAGGTIDVTNSSTVLTDNGTFVGTGALTKIGRGTLVLVNANTHTGGTVVSNGILQINNLTSLGSGGFTNVGATLKFGSGFTVSEIVNFTGNCVVDLNNPSADAALRGAWSGSGAVLITNLNNSARTFTIGGDGNGGGTMTDFTGTFNCGNCVGDIRFNDGSQKNYGSPYATFDLGTGSVRMVARNGGVTIDLGALKGGSNTRLAGRASGSSGTLTYSIGALGLDTTFAGSITNFNNATAVIKVGTGKLTLTGTNYHTGSTMVNAGELQVDGAILNSAVTVNAGTLSGTGTIGGATTLSAGAILSAGSNSVGVLTFSSSLTLDASSTNNFAVTTSGGVSNSVSVTGGLVPNGSVIKITSGTALAVGTYTLFNYSGGISGSFNPTPMFDVAPAAPATIVDTGSQIHLVIGTLAGPSFSSITTSGSDLTLNATGGTPGGSVTVLTSTNLTLPLASWTTVTTGNFDGSGNYSYPVTGALSSGQPQSFYILQVP